MRNPRADTSQTRILEHLKRRGASSIPELARAFRLSVETVRSQVKGLRAQGLVERTGTRRSHASGRAKGSPRPGRPEQIFGLTKAAEELFPRREGEILEGLASFLRDEGQHDVLVRYLERFARERRQKALARLDGLEGPERLREAARILTEEGYMAEVVEEEDSERPRLRLCHCPLSELVRATTAPCKAELGFVRALVGEGLTRVEYLPDGDGACTYAIGAKGTT